MKTKFSEEKVKQGVKGSLCTWKGWLSMTDEGSLNFVADKSKR